MLKNRKLYIMKRKIKSDLDIYLEKNDKVSLYRFEFNKREMKKFDNILKFSIEYVFFLKNGT